MSLADKHIVVGICGGVAAYKAVLLVRHLQSAGAQVRCVMTPHAKHFVGELTLCALTGESVLSDIWDASYPGEAHVALANWADMIVIAPATAQSIAKLGQGEAGNALLCTVLCAKQSGLGHVFVAPAMHHRMWNHERTQANIHVLQNAGYTLIEPEHGRLASGEHGEGRLPDPEAICQLLIDAAKDQGALRNRRILITAGPTQERLDAVRFMSNHSSGKMGYALAQVARDMGANVTLVSGPVSLTKPHGIDVVDVVSASDMHAAVFERADKQDAVVMAAAVADYTFRDTHAHKMKKEEGALDIKMVRTRDILSDLGEYKRSHNKSLCLVGFCLETEDLLVRARAKMHKKGCDIIVANMASDGFAKDTNRVHILNAKCSDEETVHLQTMSKLHTARAILRYVSAQGFSQHMLSQEG